jgi:hypothetical protein
MNKQIYIRVLKNIKLLIVAYCLYNSLETMALELTNGKQTDFVIYHQKNAVATVKTAATELQHYLKKVSGATIKITHNPPVNKFISLGVNRLSRQAGLNLNNIKADGYQIKVKNGNIYILGYDTKKGEMSTKCGFSKGTLFGTYSFIEKYLGVRWFMPGEDGEFCPTKRKILLDNRLFLIENPSFRWRYIPYLIKNYQRDGALIKQWALRNKLNQQAYSMSLYHYHIWQYIFTAKVYKKHPEYFAMLGGRRVRPVGDRYKICTSNKGTINYHAQAAIKFFDSHPHNKGFSLSPTDSAGYCQCPKCLAQDEPNRPENGALTRRILLYYNAVAKLVNKRYPERYMCGYIYADYLYPPHDRALKIAPNLFLVVASSLTYGYTFFRPEVQQKWFKIMRHWSSITHNIGYYDLPMHCSANNGAPLAPGVEQLKIMLPALKKFKVKSVYLYGDEEWGHATVYNYLLARLMWNANLDIDRELALFYQQCYGKGGRDIGKMYSLIDRAMKKYYLKNKRAAYTLTTDILGQVYAANLSRIEESYFAALSKTTNRAAVKRLKMLGESLQIMYFFLNRFGLVKPGTKSKLALSNMKFKLLQQHAKKVFYLPNLGGCIKFDAKKLPVVAVKPMKAGKNAEKPSLFLLRASSRIIMQAQNEHLIKVVFNHVTIRGSMIEYLVVTSTGKKVISGSLAANGTFSFPGKTGEIYHLFINTSSTSYNIKIANVPHAIFAGKSSKRSKGLHLLAKTTPLYFYVGKNCQNFTLTLNSESKPGSKTGGETAIGKLYNPKGQQVAKLSTLGNPVDNKRINRPMRGCWKFVPAKAAKGNFDDVYIILKGKGLASYMATDPKNILQVTKP